MQAAERDARVEVGMPDSAVGSRSVAGFSGLAGAANRAAADAFERAGFNRVEYEANGLIGRGMYVARCDKEVDRQQTRSGDVPQ